MIENECDSPLNDEKKPYSPPRDEKPNIQEIYIFDPDGRRDHDDDLKVFNMEVQKAKMRLMNKHSRSVVESVNRKEAGSDLMPTVNQRATHPTFDPVKLNPHKFSIKSSPVKAKKVTIREKQKSD